MMPVIRIPDETYARLQGLAKPFVDTPATVIDRLLDFFEQRDGAARRQPPPTAQPSTSGRPASHADYRQLDPNQPDSLTHTRVLQAKFGTDDVKKWNDLLYCANREAFNRSASFAEFARRTKSNVRQGIVTTEGYHPLDGVNVSVQNRSANQAWAEVLHLAKALKVPVKAVFRWREKEGAAYPGEYGYLEWTPQG